jgi:hypothetical protein
MGSTDIARRAGKKLASIATDVSRIAIMTNVVGSVAEMS